MMSTDCWSVVSFFWTDLRTKKYFGSGLEHLGTTSQPQIFVCVWSIPIRLWTSTEPVEYSGFINIYSWIGSPYRGVASWVLLAISPYVWLISFCLLPMWPYFVACTWFFPMCAGERYLVWSSGCRRVFIGETSPGEARDTLRRLVLIVTALFLLLSNW